MGKKKCTIEVTAEDVIFVLNYIGNFADGDPKNDIVRVIPLVDGKADWEFEKDASHALVIVGTGRTKAKVTLKIEKLNIEEEFTVGKNRKLNKLIGFNVF